MLNEISYYRIELVDLACWLVLCLLYKCALFIITWTKEFIILSNLFGLEPLFVGVETSWGILDVIDDRRLLLANIIILYSVCAWWRDHLFLLSWVWISLCP